MIPTQDRVRELFVYERETGSLTWRHAAGSGGRIPAGTRAGTAGGPDEYTVVWVDGRVHGWHQVIWLYMTGEWARADHRNLIKNDNRWENLRAASPRDNSANLPITKRNKSGYKGVSWHGRVGRWRATIAGADGKHRHLGYFDDPALAHAVYSAEAVAIRGEFARAA